MAATTTLLRWDYSDENYNVPLRSFRVMLGDLCLYRFRTDILDTDLLSETTTTFYRFNIATSRFETAGEITWIRNRSDCIISFGIHQCSSRELRRAKKQTSSHIHFATHIRSRRFKANGTEYKWKKSEDNKLLSCMDTRRNFVAEWDDESQVLAVGLRGERIMDEIIVTCLIHQWRIKSGGKW